jgi:hypothetical protein
MPPICQQVCFGRPSTRASDSPARFQVIGQPGAITEHFIDAGVRVPDERTLPDRQPRGPAELGEIATRWGIEFWTGPVEPAS